MITFTLVFLSGALFLITSNKYIQFKHFLKVSCDSGLKLICADNSLDVHTRLLCWLRQKTTESVKSQFGGGNEKESEVLSGQINRWLSHRQLHENLFLVDTLNDVGEMFNFHTEFTRAKERWGRKSKMFSFLTFVGSLVTYKMEFSLCPHTLHSTVRLADLSFTPTLVLCFSILIDAKREMR